MLNNFPIQSFGNFPLSILYWNRVTKFTKYLHDHCLLLSKEKTYHKMTSAFTVHYGRGDIIRKHRNNKADNPNSPRSEVFSSSQQNESSFEHVTIP